MSDIYVYVATYTRIFPECRHTTVLRAYQTKKDANEYIVAMANMRKKLGFAETIKVFEDFVQVVDNRMGIILDEYRVVTAPFIAYQEES